jgi:20S proteasome subunit beta 6
MLASGLAAVEARDAQSRHGWSPYIVNGGTAMAVAGENFCIVACDTRMSMGYSIMTRSAPKAAVLTNSTVIATAGMAADRDAFHKLLNAYLTHYEHMLEENL